jgi:hypothetical protein
VVLVRLERLRRERPARALQAGEEHLTHNPQGWLTHKIHKVQS